MRNEAIYLLKDQHESIKQDIETLGLEMGNCVGDSEAIAVLNRVQEQYERLADEVEIAIQKLR